MFDIGGWEFLLIGILAIVIIGPKDLPATVRTLTGWVRRARELARDFQSGLEDVAREVELDEIKNTVGLGDLGDGNSIRRTIENAIDPDGEVSGAVKDADDFLGDPMGGAASDDGGDEFEDAFDGFGDEDQDRDDDDEDVKEDETDETPDDDTAVVEPEPETEPDGAASDGKAEA